MSIRNSRFSPHTSVTKCHLDPQCIAGLVIVYTKREMAQEMYRVVFRNRPGKTNPPAEENFSYEKGESLTCKDGEIVAKTLFLSVDPYMRGRMNEEDPNAKSYITKWALGKPPTGGGVGVVIESKNENYKKGDMVQTFKWPWQDYVSLNAEDQLQKVEHQLIKEKPSLALGLCGLTGITSLVGIQVKGHLVAGTNQTVVVSGAAGACGVAAGQISKLLGSGKVVGICGTDEKCAYIKELGFDEAINYKTTKDIGAAFKACCPQGVDMYFDNVGGTISEEVIRLMNKDSHIVLCGQISQYNKDLPYPPPLPPEVQEIATKQNVTRERFLVLHYPQHIPGALEQLVTWVQEGKLRSRETVEVGLENTGKAFVSMMSGGNIGKQVVKVAEI